MWHRHPAAYLSPLRGSILILACFPRLAPWAIDFRRYAAAKRRTRAVTDQRDSVWVGGRRTQCTIRSGPVPVPRPDFGQGRQGGMAKKVATLATLATLVTF